jgi:hypothetical protein
MGVSNPYVKAFVKAYDEGGAVGEGNDSCKDMDEALEALEQGIGAWFHEVTRECGWL